jgi:hypothetical protein
LLKAGFLMVLENPFILTKDMNWQLRRLTEQTPIQAEFGDAVGVTE